MRTVMYSLIKEKTFFIDCLNKSKWCKISTSGHSAIYNRLKNVELYLTLPGYNPYTERISSYSTTLVSLISNQHRHTKQIIPNKLPSCIPRLNSSRPENLIQNLTFPMRHPHAHLRPAHSLEQDGLGLLHQHPGPAGLEAAGRVAGEADGGSSRYLGCGHFVCGRMGK